MTGVALVTGGQQGIGLAIVRELAKAGFKVAIASLPAPTDPKVQAVLEELGDAVAYIQHDVADVANIPQMLDQIEATLGPVTTLVNNAGVGSPVRGDLLNLQPDSFDTVMDINLRGAFFLAQEVARRMLSSQSTAYQSMIFITSVSADMVSVERAEYCISKAGAAMMSQLFAVRLAPHGIGVFELRPGIIETDMTAGVKDTYTPRIQDGLVPAARWGRPQDIGQTVVPLVTGQMVFSTGAVIPVDGGLSIARL